MTKGNSFVLSSNMLTSTIPTQLGKMTGITLRFKVDENSICSDVPTQVQALSSNVDAGGNSIVWKVTDGNSIGTTCGWIYDARFPGAGPTNATSIEHGSEVRHGVWVVVGRDEYVIGDVWVAGKD